MRIQYMSDLHMELYDNSRYIKANEFEVVGDVLVLAGDTFYLRDIIAPQELGIKELPASVTGAWQPRILQQWRRNSTWRQLAVDDT